LHVGKEAFAMSASRYPAFRLDEPVISLHIYFVTAMRGKARFTHSGLRIKS